MKRGEEDATRFYQRQMRRRGVQSLDVAHRQFVRAFVAHYEATGGWFPIAFAVHLYAFEEGLPITHTPDADEAAGELAARVCVMEWKRLLTWADRLEPAGAPDRETVQSIRAHLEGLRRAAVGLEPSVEDDPEEA
jgi:hypothetical protein